MIQTTILLYIDPGSGSYLVQVIIAAVLGALFYFKGLWWRIKSFFWKPRKEDPSKNEPNK
ncbi:MAG TPA: hypothetical protein VM012_15365 [Flavitalea sp.]|nr:hypothetical protein [Flavitalea sp.]